MCVSGWWSMFIIGVLASATHMCSFTQSKWKTSRCSMSTLHCQLETLYEPFMTCGRLGGEVGGELCACVCACARSHLCVCVYVCVCVRASVSVCVCASVGRKMHLSTHCSHQEYSTRLPCLELIVVALLYLSNQIWSHDG